LSVASQGSLHGRKLIGGDITSLVLAVLPTLEFVVGPLLSGALLEGVGRELAAFHGGDGGDLLKDLVFIGGSHNVTIILVTYERKASLFLDWEELRLTPEFVRLRKTWRRLDLDLCFCAWSRWKNSPGEADKCRAPMPPPTLDIAGAVNPSGAAFYRVILDVKPVRKAVRKRQWSRQVILMGRGHSHRHSLTPAGPAFAQKLRQG